MAHRSHYVLSATVAGACLVLSACGASSAPRASGSPSAGAAASSPAVATTTGHFCDDASAFMRHIPAAPSAKHASATQARANLRKVLSATVKGFTGLEAEAPHKLHKPLKKIVSIYKEDERAVRKDGSLAKISESMVRGNSTGSAAFQKVLTYISASCK